VPLETQRGYQVTIADAGVQPRLPVAVSEEKYYATPMEDGLRVAGTVEFAGLEAPPVYRRARRLLEQVGELYPGVRTGSFTEWMGHRPCLPDSLPAIGSPRGHPGLILAFGHGHNGMTSGPVTGRLIADLVAGRAPFLDPAPYSPDRF
jgi:D-amino-acid dehydrogenase